MQVDRGQPIAPPACTFAGADEVGPIAERSKNTKSIKVKGRIDACRWSA
ncbi:hypothetical protein [Amycolatopsis sp. NPDC051372]